MNVYALLFRFYFHIKYNIQVLDILMWIYCWAQLLLACSLLFLFFCYLFWLCSVFNATQNTPTCTTIEWDETLVWQKMNTKFCKIVCYKLLLGEEIETEIDAALVFYQTKQWGQIKQTRNQMNTKRELKKFVFMFIVII